MKKQIFTLCFVLIGLFAFNAQSHAQSKNAFYVELLGNGLLFSANYDMNFSDEGPWGARFGLGYIGSVDADGDGGIVTVPVLVRTLLGKDGKYFEVGGGITYIGGTADFGNDDFDSSILGTLSFQYRSQPVGGGFMWKIGITPFIAEGAFIPYWPGVSIGYSW
jgi:hypothetical protein